MFSVLDVLLKYQAMQRDPGVRTADYDQLLADWNQLCGNWNILRPRYVTLVEKYDKLAAERDALIKDRNGVIQSSNDLVDKWDALLSKHESLLDRCAQLEQERERLGADNEAVRKQVAELTEQQAKTIRQLRSATSACEALHNASSRELWQRVEAEKALALEKAASASALKEVDTQRRASRVIAEKHQKLVALHDRTLSRLTLAEIESRSKDARIDSLAATIDELRERSTAPAQYQRLLAGIQRYTGDLLISEALLRTELALLNPGSELLKPEFSEKRAAIQAALFACVDQSKIHPADLNGMGLGGGFGEQQPPAHQLPQSIARPGSDGYAVQFPTYSWIAAVHDFLAHQVPGADEARLVMRSGDGPQADSGDDWTAQSRRKEDWRNGLALLEDLAPSESKAYEIREEAFRFLSRVFESRPHASEVAPGVATAVTGEAGAHHHGLHQDPLDALESQSEPVLDLHLDGGSDVDLAADPESAAFLRGADLHEMADPLDGSMTDAARAIQDEPGALDPSSADEERGA